MEIRTTAWLARQALHRRMRITAEVIKLPLYCGAQAEAPDACGLQINT
jgi:hypothetical protein